MIGPLKVILLLLLLQLVLVIWFAPTARTE